MPPEVGPVGFGTVPGVWAHPDDETHPSAGSMVRAVRDGPRVVCVTATRGEDGSMDVVVSGEGLVRRAMREERVRPGTERHGP
jgi:LmbE family N-acetylglucosaminyl deacetylase